MAAAAVASYSHDLFQRLPTLEDAKTNFAKVNGQDLVENFFRTLFVKARMDRVFGLTMLHRHFDLPDNEKMVEYGGTSTPWAATIPGMKDPQPAIWAFDVDGPLKPTEFRYSETQDNPFTEE